MRREDTLDGLTFEPWPGGTAEPRPSRPVFSEQDRERFAADPALRPYLALTQDQVAGLLCALDRSCVEMHAYEPELSAPRIGPAEMDAETLAAAKTLANVLREVDYAPPELTPSSWPPPDPDAVFDAAEQHELSYRKNVKGFERLTRAQLVRVLRALDAYAVRAPVVDVYPTPTVVLLSRLLHAHNVIVAFRERPLTLQQYGDEVRAVIVEALDLEKRARQRAR